MVFRVEEVHNFGRVIKRDELAAFLRNVVKYGDQGKAAVFLPLLDHFEQFHAVIKFFVQREDHERRVLLEHFFQFGPGRFHFLQLSVQIFADHLGVGTRRTEEADRFLIVPVMRKITDVIEFPESFRIPQHDDLYFVVTVGQSDLEDQVRDKLQLHVTLSFDPKDMVVPERKHDRSVMEKLFPLCQFIHPVGERILFQIKMFLREFFFCSHRDLSGPDAYGQEIRVKLAPFPEALLPFREMKRFGKRRIDTVIGLDLALRF